MNWHHVDRHYNFPACSLSALSLIRLCNLFVHSYVFMTVHSENGGLQGVLVNTDRIRLRCLYQADIDDLAKTLTAVGNDDPVEMRATFDPATQDYDIRQYRQRLRLNEPGTSLTE